MEGYRLILVLSFISLPQAIPPSLPLQLKAAGARSPSPAAMMFLGCASVPLSISPPPRVPCVGSCRDSREISEPHSLWDLGWRLIGNSNLLPTTCLQPPPPHNINPNPSTSQSIDAALPRSFLGCTILS